MYMVHTIKETQLFIFRFRLLSMWWYHQAGLDSFVGNLAKGRLTIDPVLFGFSQCDYCLWVYRDVCQMRTTGHL